MASVRGKLLKPVVSGDQAFSVVLVVAVWLEQAVQQQQIPALAVVAAEPIQLRALAVPEEQQAEAVLVISTVLRLLRMRLVPLVPVALPRRVLVMRAAVVRQASSSSKKFIRHHRQRLQVIQ